MARRRIGQLGFADGLVAQRRGRGRNRLDAIDRMVDWSRLEALLPVVSPSRRGEAAYPPLMMFKALLVQRWYGLSDPGMEEALDDRLSFRTFVGLSLADATPDHATLWRFRERLVREERMEALLGELERQFEEHGVILRQGTLIDATLISSAARRPRMKEGKTSPADPQAQFGTNNERRRFTFGYKLHVGVDCGSTLVRRLRLTPANVQEIRMAEALVAGDEAAVYADRGYDSGAFHRHLAERGIADGIIRRGTAARPLSFRQQELNRRLSLRRRPVETVFGTLKRSYGFARMRYFTLERNAVALALACMAYNLRRLHTLTAP